ncbi:uncharacterized protein LOC110006735 [Amborella trichopoda]|uniref:uncharacterized protein LOC110006735 n=1 Tax=Amborella trichopoda TaxID=13333 RepID=UPI0009BFFAD4|nr:uncharacterized protein LOC110006735 [Amborella trichopoda]|eukprot:XP_020519199.1 uncharacterized protein LOC110006735 [Amborella trichopoda]
MTIKFGPLNTESRLKSKYKFFKTMCSDIKKLMNVSGFGWDARRRIVTVDSAVWIDYLAENEWANKYHNKMLPEYSLLSKIYVGNTADGMYKSTEGGITIESERPETPFSNDPLVEVQVQSSSSSSDDPVSLG